MCRILLFFYQIYLLNYLWCSICISMILVSEWKWEKYFFHIIIPSFDDLSYFIKLTQNVCLGIPVNRRDLNISLNLLPIIHSWHWWYHTCIPFVEKYVFFGTMRIRCYKESDINISYELSNCELHTW